MRPQPIQDSRIQKLNNRGLVKGSYVLYWMQQAQRAELNHALEYAIQTANQLGQQVLVIFGLMDDYPEANLRHYTFMLEGLRETQASLAAQGIKMVIQRGSPADIAVTHGQRASLIVCDGGYLGHQKAWRIQVATEMAADNAALSMVELYKSFLLRMVVVMALLVIGFIVLKLQPGALIIGFVVAHIGYLFARPVGTAKRRVG